MWLFRALAALGVPAALLLGLEAGLRVAGYGCSPHILIPDTLPGFYRTNPDYLRLFLPRSFDLRPLNFRVAAHKPPNTVRVVVLGESAAEGVPEPAFGFAPQLRAQLRARFPGKNIEVLNTGIVAIDSHVIYPIARDLARFSPDVFVIYAGNNEVVGPYGPGCAYLSRMPPLWLIRLSVGVRTTRTGQLLAAGLDWLARHGRRPPAWGGMAMFAESAVRADDPRLAVVYRNFEANLRAIVGVAAACGAKTVLCTVVSNLKDCAPFLSLHRPDLAGADLAAWEAAFDRARLEWTLGERAAASADLQTALRLDPEYADPWYMLGTLELAAGHLAAGRSDLLAAQHWDALRFRPDPRINEIIRRVGRDGGPSVTVVDAARAMGSDPASTVAPAGREILFEHVHFDWEGNFELARLLAQGVEASLGGDRAERPGWLDSAGCAAALAYTPHERAAMLQRDSRIVENPPFNNQLTYVVDQAEFARAQAAADTERVAPPVLERAHVVVEAAIAADPENPFLAKIAEEIDDDRGDLAGALAQIRRAETLQPESAALAMDEAIKLGRLGRFPEAEALLRRTARTCPPRDQGLLAVAFADFFKRTRRFEEGRRYFDAAIHRHPNDAKLYWLRGGLARMAGDMSSAERDYRAARDADPGNPDVLESLINLLGETGRTAEAAQESLAATEQQPHNYVNNLRAMLISLQSRDTERSVPLLLATEHSGPMSTAVELNLTRQLREQGRRRESLLHLAFALRLARIEGDTDTAGQIAQLLERLRAEPP